HALEAAAGDGQPVIGGAEEIHLAWLAVTAFLLAPADAQRRMAGQLQLQLAAESVGKRLVMADLVGPVGQQDQLRQRDETIGGGDMAHARDSSMAVSRAMRLSGAPSASGIQSFQ